MRNILKVFLTDVQRLSTNVVAVVVIMGLCVLPSLYAWFNIFSNWDPYGQESTSNMKIAVFSADEGEEIAGETLNIGSSVVDGLKSNSTIGWVFAATEAEAVEGVRSGDYYAALIIPDGFTADMISFLNGEVEHPQITYYENDKKNAIAPKITSKAKTAVQEQVNATFVSTLAEVLAGSGRILTAADENGGTLLDTVIDSLKQLQEDVDTGTALLTSFVEITDAAQNVIDISEKMLPGMQDINTQSEHITECMKSLLTYAEQTGDTADDMVSYSLQTLTQSLDSLKNAIDSDKTTADAYGAAAQAAIDQAKAMLPYLQSMYEGAVASIEGQDADTDAQIAAVREELAQLKKALDEASSSQSVTDTKQLISQITALMQNIETGISNIKGSYADRIKPQADTAEKTAEGALGRAALALQGMDGVSDTVTPVLENYQKALSSGKKSLKQSLELSQELSDELGKVTDDLTSLSEDEQYQQLMEILQKNPEALGEYVSSPVNLDTVAIYPIATYGSAMTPFYTVLALWVGALILVAIIHVRVEPIEGVTIRSWQAYFGRYLIFFLIGQIQTLITVLGDLFYIRIQCTEPLLFYLAAAITSMVFTLFIYSLTVAFQNIGEALAVIIMVVQVAGAGGTFPVEVLPKVYQAVYRYLPFPYAMNSMRETIGGMYADDYWHYLLILSSYVMISLVIGLLLGRPFRSLNHRIEKSKEKSGLMI